MITARLSGQAIAFVSKLGPALRQHTIDVIKAAALRPGDYDVVLGWTNDPDWPHLERKIKVRVPYPGYRILFHVTSTPRGIYIDRIAWRDCDPYLDGH